MTFFFKGLFLLLLVFVDEFGLKQFGQEGFVGAQEEVEGGSAAE